MQRSEDMKYLFTCLALVSFHLLSAQQEKREDDIFFKKYLVRSMDFNEKGNREIFGTDQYMVRLLLDAYCSGKLKGYKNQKLSETLSYEQFESRLTLLQPEENQGIPLGDLHLIEIGEHLIFNKHTSDFYFSMESITMYIPADKSYRGIQEPLISFSYKDCSRIFKADQHAVSVNPLKNGRDINYAEVFLLRLFNSSIVKIGNTRDLYFDQVYDDKMSAFLAAKAGENQLTEYLYKLYHPE
jgi:hypothetical protein